jgi:hypothetical protein
MPLYLPPSIDIQLGADIAASVMGGVVSRAGAANTAYFVAFRVSRSKTVTKSRHRVTASSGNVDAGIYDSAGTRLASSGSTACGGANAEQELTFTASYVLQPGVTYYRAFAADNATATCWDVSGALGFTTSPTAVFSVVTSFPLPASVTVPGSGSATRNFIQVIE